MISSRVTGNVYVARWVGGNYPAHLATQILLSQREGIFHVHMLDSLTFSHLY